MLFSHLAGWSVRRGGNFQKTRFPGAQIILARGVIDPLLALWVPFLLFAGLAIWMYYTLAHVPGGQPIGALERVAAKAGARIRGLIRIFQRKQQTA